jgi:L-ascorbate metabolism protein UlaG (beta-lactamase superfamily)
MSAFSSVIVHVCFVLFFPGATIVVSGDGRYFSKDAVQVI